MLIENPDAFKNWLTSVLEPLCDADPQALAKYVFALVRKDKSDEALRQGMLDQLDVFLQAETRPFVELLFKTLETQEYLRVVPSIPNANPPNPNVPPLHTTAAKKDKEAIPDAALVAKEIKNIIPVSMLPNLSETINGTSAAVSTATPVVANIISTTITTASNTGTPNSGGRTTKATEEARPRKTDIEKTESGRTRRNRSRSRSWERPAKRSRSRERSPRQERRDRSRPWRNKSPPRRYDRDRRRSRSSSRSPRHIYRSSGRYRNRSPPRSPSRSRSRSNERTSRLATENNAKESGSSSLAGKKNLNNEENSGAATPTQDSNHGDTDMRLTSSIQSIHSVVSALKHPGDGFGGSGAAGPPPGTQVAAPPASKRRCRDFDEKGYCMRGEMCPYDHGVDPVVLEDTALSHVLTFGPNGAPVVAPGGAPGVDGPPPPGPPGLMHPGAMMVPGMHPGHHRVAAAAAAASLHPAEYNPSAPAMWHHRPGFRPRGPPMGLSMRAPLAPGTAGPFGPMPSMQRELISVPVTDDGNSVHPPGSGPPAGFKRRPGDYDGGPPSKRKGGMGFDFNRLGPRAAHLPSTPKNPANCSLELKKVPRGLNNITHLNNHFSKFGKIVNIQVCYEGDPEGAIITFSSHAEANVAYRSTEAVLNNRFIKVFWHTGGGSAAGGGGENIPPMHQHQQHHHRTIKERLGQPVNKVLNLVQPKASGIDVGGALTAPGTEPEEAEEAVKGNGAIGYVPSALKKEESRAIANAAIVKGQEILAAKEQLKKKHEEKRKEALKITQDLRKRKQELLEKQLAHQKLLIEKLEKTNPSGPQRDLLKETIKTVQESIESIRKDMLSSTAGAAGTGLSPVMAVKALVPRKSKEEAQKEVLDAELDLMTKQQEGGDTSELQLRLMELRAQAYSLARGSGAVGGRRGRALRGRHHLVRRPGLHPHHLQLSKNNLVLDAKKRLTHTVVDHRPTRLLVSGYEADDSDSVVAHFSQFGEITEYITDPSTPSIALNYRSRKEAEVALLKGKHFQDRTLSITWCTEAQLSSAQRSPHTRTVVLTSSVIPTNNNASTAVIPKSASNNNTSHASTPSSEEAKGAASALPTWAPVSPAWCPLSPSWCPPSPFYGPFSPKWAAERSDKADEVERASSDDKQVQVAEAGAEEGAELDADDVTEPNTSEDQLLEGDDENVSGEQLGAELSEEALLQDDEEDDDENEDRSWRR